MRLALIAATATLPLLAGGCIGTVKSVVTAPFKIVGQATDWATTSQDEADRNYGRKARKQEAREGRERRDSKKKCKGDDCAYEGYRAGDEERDYERE